MSGAVLKRAGRLQGRIWVPLAWAISVVCVAGVAWSAARATFTPPQLPADALPPATYVVTEASIGATLPVTVSVTWYSHMLAAGSLSGMVTGINLPQSGIIGAGDVLLSIGLRPVVVAQGSVPAFRDLKTGVAGDDVRQLQTFLQSAGYLTDQPDGKFQATTATAVRVWQSALGVERTGIVRAGDVLFVPSLPAHVVLSDGVAVGAIISPGQPVLSVVDEVPVFHAKVGGNTASSVTPKAGQRVTVVPPDGSMTWEAVVTQVGPDATGGISALLAAPGGDSVCADKCALLGFSPDGVLVGGTLVVSPEVKGPAVPLAAVGTAPDGSRFVVRPDGARVTVTVVGGDASRLIVKGLEVGDIVELFAG